MKLSATLSSATKLAPLREQYRAEMACQVIHDSIHNRAGWTKSYLLSVDGAPAGFAELAIAGPWKEQPTLIEFFVVPVQRGHVFRLFETLVAASGARRLETQTNGTLLAHLLPLWSKDFSSEKILFRDVFVTSLAIPGTVLRRTTSDEETQAAMARRSGGCECALEFHGKIVGTGGILFHYNVPYGDLHMEIAEPHRRRGLGAFFVQELKRLAYELGAKPGARCSPTNVASRMTLQKAGFVPCGHMISGSISPELTPRADRSR